MYARVLQRALSTGVQPRGALVYQSPGRVRAAAVSALAVGQAGFWGSAAAMAATAPEQLLGPAWSMAGFGLSAAFVGMVNAYLRRSVAEMTVVSGAAGPHLEVTAHAFGGMLRKPKVIEAAHILPGPKGADPAERYWTFGVSEKEDGPRFYYILDTAKGVCDPEALAAVVRGGEHLMVLSHRRQAGEMRQRWLSWQREEGTQQ